MKKYILLIVVLFSGILVSAQELVFDQNPDFFISQTKYMKLSDSIIRWHSTTSQQTYKAIDYLADKAEARQARKQFRRDIRMQRAMNNYGGYGYDSYFNGWGGYNNYGYYNNRSYFNNWSNPLIWGNIGAPYFWHRRFR